MAYLETKKLQGAQLDWAVAAAAGIDVLIVLPNPYPHAVRLAQQVGTSYHPSTNWSQAGPLFDIDGEAITVYEDMHWNGGDLGTERFLACYRIGIEPKVMGYGSTLSGAWTKSAETFNGLHTCPGDTYLVAAMRCFVTSRLSDYIDVPSELTPTTA